MPGIKAAGCWAGRLAGAPFWSGGDLGVGWVGLEGQV